MIRSSCRALPVFFLVPLLVFAPTPDAHAGAKISTAPGKLLFTLNGDGKTPLVLPTDVAVDDTGRTFVVDGGNHRVVVFSRRGKPELTIGSKGNKEGRFLNPVGIDVDREGQVYVADKDNHRIQVFSSEGKFRYSFALSDRQGPVSPVDVAVAADGKRLYITGNNNHRVMVYSLQGKAIGSWGGKGVNKGEFRYPATIAVSPNGRVYIVDVFNTRVQVFSPAGKFILEFGEWGVLPGQLVRPKGVSIGPGGRIYVSDSYMDVIQAFNDAHLYTHVLGKGGQPTRFTSAAGITVDKSNRLYVAEVLKHRVAVYQLGK